MNTAPDTLEESLEADRANLRETLSAIEEKMSPGRMIDEAMSYFQTGPKEFAALLGDQMKSNPMPILLTGVGLAWLMASGSKSMSEPGSSPAPSGLMDDDHEAWATYDRITQFELDCSRMPDEPHDTWQTRLHAQRASALGLQQSQDEDEHGFMSRVGQAADAARTKGAAARDRVRESLQNATQAGGRMMHDSKAAISDLSHKGKAQGQSALHSMTQLHEANPMVTGAMAIALGAMLGALIPQGEREEAALGDVADRGLDQAAMAAQAAAEALTAKLSPEPAGDFQS